MKHFGIDYGDKRVGIAISDPGGKIAFPKRTVFNNKYLFTQLKSIIEEEGVLKIVVGLPFSFNGQESGQFKKTKIFAENLKKITSLPIAFENEVLTTKIAKGSGVKKERIDESSAALILQGYLDKRISSIKN